MASLSLDVNDLQPVTTVVGEKDEFPDFTRELIQVQWRSGDAIDLYVIKPHAISKPPAVLYLYSYPSETDRFRDNDYCQRVTAGGYAAIGFVSALTGQRYHDRPMREWFVSELPEALTTSVHDVQMIINYLSNRGDIDISHVGIFGQGSGATIAILSAAVDPRLQAVDALQPWGDWPVWLAQSSLIPQAERANYLKPAFLAKVAPLDPVQWLGRVQAKEVRLQFVLDDPITPAEVVQRLKAAASSYEQVVEFQSKRDQYNTLAGGHSFDWVKKQLRAPASHNESASATRDTQNVSPH